MAGAAGPMGFAAFTGVKFVGYTLAALALKKAFARTDANVFQVGLARTGIGLVVGTLFGGAAILLASSAHTDSGYNLVSVLFFALLIPIRLGEWSLLIHFFFDRGLIKRAKDLRYAALGTVWSFLLDAVGIYAAFVVPGGVWIC
jgi:hypothetical protein